MDIADALFKMAIGALVVFVLTPSAIELIFKGVQHIYKKRKKLQMKKEQYYSAKVSSNMDIQVWFEFEFDATDTLAKLRTLCDANKQVTLAQFYQLLNIEDVNSRVSSELYWDNFHYAYIEYVKNIGKTSLYLPDLETKKEENNDKF